MSDQFKNVDVDEYLDKIGFRAKGTRGRLSERCKKAVETAITAGMTFKNWDVEERKIIREKATAASPGRPRKAKSSVTAPEPIHFSVVRGANAMKITDADGNETVLDYHPTCNKPISRCLCKVVDAPSYYGEAKVELIQI